MFPLDADNLLSPNTLARLSTRLEEGPGAAWAYPALEFFGAERGEWRVPGPYLPYRQLLSNQCDAGSLIRRAVFEAGIGYDETMRDGFEDWEFFLGATLAGFRGVAAGRCGFRYRRQPDSMVATALQRAEQLEAAIRDRHPRAYEPAAVAQREHAEAPRFALVRCDTRGRPPHRRLRSRAAAAVPGRVRPRDRRRTSAPRTHPQRHRPDHGGGNRVAGGERVAGRDALSPTDGAARAQGRRPRLGSPPRRRRPRQRARPARRRRRAGARSDGRGPTGGRPG